MTDRYDDINTVINASNHILKKAKTALPYPCCQTTIEVDEDKVTIRKLLPIGGKRVIPIMIHDILSIQLFAGILFAGLQFEVRGFEQNPESIKYLWRTDAEELRRIITGLMICENRHIDYKKYEPNNLKETLNYIGMAKQF